MNTTAVVFRVWQPEGTVLALFPYEKEHSGLCSSYEHVGQHASADYTGCIQRSRPATSAEYAPLKSELEHRGYTLRVLRRRG